MSKLEELKREVINILLKQDKEEKQVKKAFEYEDFFNQYKKNFGELDAEVEKGKLANIGEVRTWKGKKYKKIAPGKWARMYEKEGRGTNIAVGKLIAKVKKIDNVEDLMALVKANEQRFVDENGKDLPILDKIRAEVNRQSGKIGSKGKTVEDKVKENPDYPFKPMTDKERAERAAFEKDRDDFIERMDKIRQENKKKDSKPAEKKEEVSFDEVSTSLDEMVNKNEKSSKIIGGVKVSYDPQNGYRITHKAPTGKEITTGYDTIEEAHQAVMYRLNRIKNGEIQKIEKTEKKEEKHQNNKQGKLPSGYVTDLSIEKQGELHKLLKEHFIKEGMSGMEIADALDNAMDSKISDLEEIYNKNKEVKKLLMNTDSDSSSFKLSDIYDRNTHDKMKQVQSFDEAKNVIKQIADNYGPTEKGRKLLENFMSYNVGGSNPIYDKVYEHFGISYNDLDADFDAAKNKILKLASGQKNVSKEDKKIQQGKDDFASRYRAAIEQEDKNFQKKEGSKTDGKTENNEKEEKIKKYEAHIRHQLGMGDIGDLYYSKEKYVSILQDTIQKYGKKSFMGIASQRIIDSLNKESGLYDDDKAYKEYKELVLKEENEELTDEEYAKLGRLMTANENYSKKHPEKKWKGKSEVRKEEEKKKTFTPKVKKSFSEEIQDILKTLKK